MKSNFIFASSSVEKIPAVTTFKVEPPITFEEISVVNPSAFNCSLNFTAFSEF